MREICSANKRNALADNTGNGAGVQAAETLGMDGWVARMRWGWGLSGPAGWQAGSALANLRAQATCTWTTAWILVTRDLIVPVGTLVIYDVRTTRAGDGTEDADSESDSGRRCYY